MNILPLILGYMQSQKGAAAQGGFNPMQGFNKDMVSSGPQSGVSNNEFGVTGMPPSLDAQLGAEAGGIQRLPLTPNDTDRLQNLPYDPNSPGTVLPLKNTIPVDGLGDKIATLPVGITSRQAPTMQAYSQQPRDYPPQNTAKPMSFGQQMGNLLQGSNGFGDGPNALVRLGEGYNRGGLIGALGYLLTDMSNKSAQGNPPRAINPQTGQPFELKQQQQQNPNFF